MAYTGYMNTMATLEQQVPNPITKHHERTIPNNGQHGYKQVIINNHQLSEH